VALLVQCVEQLISSLHQPHFDEQLPAAGHSSLTAAAVSPSSAAALTATGCTQTTQFAAAITASNSLAAERDVSVVMPGSHSLTAFTSTEQLLVQLISQLSVISQSQ